MPRRIEMSWTASKTRWRKMYKGVTHTVFCSELDLPVDQWTELGSYTAANAWWLARKAEIDGRRRALPESAEEILRKLKERKAHTEREGLEGEARSYAEAIRDAEASLEANEYDLVDIDPKTVARLKLLEAMGFTIPGDLDTASLEAALGADAQWEDRLRGQKTVVLSKRLGTHLDTWYELVHRRAKPSSISNIRAYYNEFKDLRYGSEVVLHEGMEVSSIDEACFAKVHRAFSMQTLGEATRKKKWAFFRQFVKYLSENGSNPLPRNFQSKHLVFSPRTTSKAAPDVAALRTFLDALPERLRLYALLALNCGMNNVDIGRLRHDQVDWVRGTLTRKRVKTEDSPNVPTVVYSLWAETSRLLRLIRSGHAELALTSEAGEPLYVTSKGATDAYLYDRIKSQWRDHFKRGSKKPYTIKQFRFFGADLLKANIRFRSYRDPFLGHAPRSSSEKSYSSDEDVSVGCQYLEGLFYPVPKLPAGSPAEIAGDPTSS